MNQQEEFDKINEYIDQMLATIANLRIENQRLCEKLQQERMKSAALGCAVASITSGENR